MYYKKLKSIYYNIRWKIYIWIIKTFYNDDYIFLESGRCYNKEQMEKYINKYKEFNNIH